MIKAVFFDLDGTLIKSLGNYLQAYREILKHYGFSFSDEEVVKRCFGRTEETITKELGMPEKAEEFRSRYFEYVRKALPTLQLFPDAIATLEGLKSKQIKIGFITFAHSWYMSELSKSFNFPDYAQVMISFNDVKNPKPDPEAVISACKTLSVNESEVLVVGDSKSDIVMGKNARSKTALYTPEDNKKFYNFEDLVKEANPDFVIKTLKEVVDLVV